MRELLVSHAASGEMRAVAVVKRGARARKGCRATLIPVLEQHAGRPRRCKRASVEWSFACRLRHAAKHIDMEAENGWTSKASLQASFTATETRASNTAACVSRFIHRSNMDSSAWKI